MYPQLPPRFTHADKQLSIIWILEYLHADQVLSIIISLHTLKYGTHFSIEYGSQNQLDASCAWLCRFAFALDTSVLAVNALVRACNALDISLSLGSLRDRHSRGGILLHSRFCLLVGVGLATLSLFPSPH